MSKRIMVVFGTRPECIKLAPVIAALRNHPAGFKVTTCSTGQHEAMLQQAMACFGLRPEIDLAVMRAGGTLSDLTAELMTALTHAISETKPDWVVVQGDTTTAFVAALAAYYQRVRVAHVEAGLRSSDRFNPFPEEINRRFITQLCDLHFSPTRHAADCLRREGISAEAIHLTGNTVVDAVAALQAGLATKNGMQRISPLIRTLAQASPVLITCHRRENFGEDLAAICRAIAQLARRYPTHSFVFPVHLNPSVQGPVRRLLGDIANVHLLEPVDYPDMICLLSSAILVLSDSGGIQEEAPSFGVPVLVLRRKTERPEGIEGGFAELVGADEQKIVERASAHLSHGAASSLPGRRNPYGDGHAAQRIADILARTT